MAQLKRRLGLYAVFTVSIGAMIGSGIFVLPGLAFAVGGPAMILAYLLAGLVVLPAALAKSEMATAIPRAGGTYLYIDMAMGPLMGTIAGFGVWFSLVFKSAFALDGLGLYLELFTDFDFLDLGLAIGLGLIVVNLIGIKESGNIQAFLVTVVFGLLFFFVGGGAIFVDSANYQPFFPAGSSGLLATAALVFVSYAGVTKVASIAEEVSNPARTLPVAIITSLLVMMFVYPAVTYVMVGVTPPEILRGDLTPLATAGAQLFSPWVVTAIAVIGVLALASMANAGLLASSRYPFAMARRGLAPAVFSRVGTRSGVPVLSLVLTGALLLGLVAFLPVFELAKLASAFQLLMFAMINLAQIAFRSSKLWWYRPKFHAPGYPFVPVAGLVACLVLITQLGLQAILGAVGIIVGGVIWYQIYGRSRAIKESAFRESVRQQGMARLLELTAEALDEDARRVAVIAAGQGVDSSLLRVGRPLAGSEPGSELVDFLEAGPGLGEKLDHYSPDLVVASVVEQDTRSLDQLPHDRDVVLLSGRVPGEINRIAVLGSGGPFDVLKICLAAKLAEQEDASIRFVHVLDTNASRAQVRSLEKFHSELAELVPVPSESMVIESDDLMAALREAVDDADVAIIGAPPGRHLFTDLIDRIIHDLAIPVLVVRVAEEEGRTTLRGFLDRFTTTRVSPRDATHHD
jgi:amino acid transporter/nucleotide-binding universal stress UspA family protein